jgi:epoxyqueuosine reductase
VDDETRQEIERRFARLCSEVGREGVIGFTSVEGVRLLPEQAQRLQQKLSGFSGEAGTAKHAERNTGSTGRGSGREGSGFGAVSLGLFYQEPEILAIPATWQKSAGSERWNDYARAYHELNRCLDYVSSALAAEFDGVAEKATIEGWAGKVQHVNDYFAHCVSHRAFAEAAELGWRGRHGLIVTPEAGPAVRFATVFMPFQVQSQHRELAGCGDCRACLDICPILRRGHPAPNAGRTPSTVRDYREACRRRIYALGLAADVCGICVRVCWERVCR